MADDKIVDLHRARRCIQDGEPSQEELAEARRILHGDNFRPADSIPLDLLPADIMAAARDDAALRQVIAKLEADVARLNAALRAVVARLDGGPGGDAA